MKRKKYLYLIEKGGNVNYDDYDSAVVVASSQAQARKIHPNGTLIKTKDDWKWSWCHPDKVKVRKVGVASARMKLGTVICASYNGS